MKSVFFSYVKNNKRVFLMLVIIFLVGIALGIGFINHANEIQMQEISAYVISLKENIKNSDNINKTFLLVQSMKQNMTFVLMIWLLGCTILRRFFNLCWYFIQRILNWIYSIKHYCGIRCQESEHFLLLLPCYYRT